MSQPADHPESIILRFEDMAYGGDAVGRANGMAVFAWPGIEGEEARVTITARRPKLLRAQVTEVLAPSPLRVTPPCPYFGPCGGCQWQHVSYDGQVDFKNNILRTQLERLGGLADAAFRPSSPLASPQQFGYRNTSHFALDVENRTLGYFQRDSHTVVPVAQCPISNPGVNAAIPLVNEVLRLAEAGEREPGEVKGVMRVWHITVRSSEATGQTLIVFHTRASGRATPRAGRGRQPARAAMRPDEGPAPHPVSGNVAELPLLRKQVRRLIYDAVQHANPEMALTSVEVMDDGTVNMLGQTRAAATLSAEAQAETLSGTLLSEKGKREPQIEMPLGAWVERLGGHNYWIAPGAFFQANTGAAELLLAEVLSVAPAHVDLAIDAHAGVGTFGLALSGRATKVLAFESASSAVASGRWTAAVSRISNVEYRHGTAETLMTRLKTSEVPDLVILDPPRTGCHSSLLSDLARRNVASIIYVSCDPSTLARDLKILTATHEVTSVRLVDMFPQTFHIETVVALKARS